MGHALAGFLLTVSLAQAAAPPAPWKLTTEDRNFLERLLPRLVDPRGAERVEVPVLTHPSRWKDEAVVRQVWRLPGGDGKPPRYLAPDGCELIPMGGARRIDFVQACRDRLVLDESEDRLEHAVARYRVGEHDDLAIPVWLYRLGHEGLAARFLAVVENRDQDLKEMRSSLKYARRDAMLAAYYAGFDDTALAHARGLARLYPEMTEAPRLIADLERRRKAGTGERPFPPDGIVGWPVPKKVAYLIDALEDASLPRLFSHILWAARHESRVSALIKIGPAAVPALLDAIEKDGRLTRLRARWRGLNTLRPVMPVREAALVALLSILDAHLQLGYTHEEYPLLPYEPAKLREAVAELRDYWKRVGHLYAERRPGLPVPKPLPEGR